MLCHNFLIGKERTCALRTTCVEGVHVSTYVRTTRAVFYLVVCTRGHTCVCVYRCCGGPAWCEGGSESVDVCCPAIAPSLNWQSCILTKHTWFSVHMCTLSQSGSCDIIRTRVLPKHTWFSVHIACVPFSNQKGVTQHHSTCTYV